MKTNKIFLSAVTGILLSSCATSRQFSAMPVETTTDQTKSTVYVLRRSILLPTFAMPVFCNKQLIGETGPRGYVCFEVNAGNNSIGSKAENLDFLKLNLQQGKTYYIKQKMTPGLMFYRCKLKEINEEKGKKMLAKLRKPAIVSVQ